MALDREAIAEALSTVEGVEGFSFRPTDLNDGDGFPLVVTLERGPGQNFQAVWKVVVVLPSDEVAGMEWFTDNFQAISDALEESDGIVDLIEPGIIDTEAGVRSCMILTYRNEA